MKKAQVSAPIELLIGVIILTMVMTIGFFVQQNMCTAQYDQKMKATIAKFANDLETVYAGSPGTSIISSLDFTTIGCGGEVKAVKFIAGTEAICQKEVGLQNCYMLTATGMEVVNNEPKGTIRFAQVLKIPTDVSIIHYQKSLTTAATESICATQNLLEKTAFNPPIGMTVDYSKYSGTSVEGILNDPQKAGFQDTCFNWATFTYSLTITKLSKKEILISEVN